MQTRSILLFVAVAIILLAGFEFTEARHHAKHRSHEPSYLTKIPNEIIVKKPKDLHAHPWPQGPQTFKNLMKQSLRLREGNYRIRDAVSGKYMTFFSGGNDIRMKTGKKGGGSDLGKNGQIFRISHHKHHKYHNLYSIHRPNESGNDKCLSAGYSYVANTYALMYMCRIETKKSSHSGVTTGGSMIKFDKQVWIAIRGAKNTIKLVTTAHLDHYKPRCIYPAHSQGYGAMKPHHYKGLALLECNFDKKKGKVFDWILERA